MSYLFSLNVEFQVDGMREKLDISHKSDTKQFKETHTKNLKEKVIKKIGSHIQPKWSIPKNVILYLHSKEKIRIPGNDIK